MERVGAKREAGVVSAGDTAMGEDNEPGDGAVSGGARRPPTLPLGRIDRSGSPSAYALTYGRKSRCCS
jgi:hypothetical protein